MQRRISLFIKKHFQDNFIIYFILSIFLILGIIIGSVLINKMGIKEDYTRIRSFSQIINYINKEYRESNSFIISRLLSSFKITFVIWILGFTVLSVFFIPIIINLKGVSIGITVGYLVKKFGLKGFVFSLLSLLPHYLIVLPATLIMCSIAMSMGRDRQRTKTIYRMYKNKFTEYSIILFICMVIVSIGSFVGSLLIEYSLRFIHLI